MLSAITFVPQNNVAQSFEELVDHLRNSCSGDSGDLLDYFEDTYIGKYQKMLRQSKQTTTYSAF